jgi:hypothetical protein
VHHKRVAAWLLLAFAILNKPPILVLVPLFALEPFFNGEPSGRIRRLAQASGGVLLSLVLGYLLALPFYADRDVISIYRDMINWYQVGSSLYPVNSANAFNLFAFSNDFFESDTTMYGALALRYWADALFIAAAAVVYWFSAYRGNDRSIVKGAFLLMLGFFCFLTEMHERYLIYALFLVAPLVVFDVRYRWFAAVLTITLWLNLDYSLTYMWLGGDNPNGVDARQFAPVLARLCAGANIVVFIGGLLALAQQASDKLLPLPECPLRPRPIEPA